MKSFFVLFALICLALFPASAYANYGNGDVKTDVKDIDKGIVITVTSDEPGIVKEIRNNGQHYDSRYNYTYQCPNMGSTISYRHYGCCW